MSLTVGEANLYTTTSSAANNSRTSTNYLNSVIEEGLKSENKKTEEKGGLPERQKALIEKYKDKYDIRIGKVYSSSLGRDIDVYFIKAKKDINLSELCDNLKTDMNIVAQNMGYKQYDGQNGSYIGNRRMLGEEIHVPVDKFGANTNLWEDIVEWVTNKF